MQTFSALTVVLLLAIWASTAQSAEKPKKAMLKSRMVQTETAKKTLGYFTVHEHSVTIDSAGGTIHLELPRLGPSHPVEDKKTTRERMWPVGSPEYTEEFMDWIDQVQRASDAGVLKPKRTE